MNPPFPFIFPPQAGRQLLLRPAGQGQRRRCAPCCASDHLCCRPCCPQLLGEADGGALVCWAVPHHATNVAAAYSYLLVCTAASGPACSLSSCAAANPGYTHTTHTPAAGCRTCGGCGRCTADGALAVKRTVQSGIVLSSLPGSGRLQLASGGSAMLMHPLVLPSCGAGDLPCVLQFSLVTSVACLP